MTDETGASSPTPTDQPPRDVDASEIYLRVSSLEPKAKTFLEAWGVRFMRLLLYAIVVATCLVLLAWFATRPDMQDVETILGQADPNDPAAAARLDALERLCQNHLNHFQDLFQMLVLGGLVPLFTLMAGYVFGRHQAERTQQEETQTDET